MHHSEIVKIETKTETVVTTKKVVQAATNAFGPMQTYFSIQPWNSAAGTCTIDLVIGANFEHRCASAFDKSSLKELIDLLVDIHEAMV